MKKDKLTTMLSALLIIVLGVLVAIFGAAAVLNLYFGIAACVAGACLLAFSIVLMIRKELVPPLGVVGGAALVAIGVGLIVGKIDAGVLIGLLVFAVLGGGAGLLCYGIYLLTKKATNLGILDLIVGVAALTLAILYLAVAGFAQAFWIIVGILIAIYGVSQIVIAALKK